MNTIKSFKQWVIDHDPTVEWDFDNPMKLHSQLSQVLEEGGCLDIITLVQWVMSIDTLIGQKGTYSGLTSKQEINFTHAD